MNESFARRQSGAREELEMAQVHSTRATHWQDLFFGRLCNDRVRRRLQSVAGLAGFLGLCAVVLFRVSGLMVIGLPAGVSITSLDSGPRLKNTRQPGESWALFRTMQAVIRSTSGISGPHSLMASPEQACCCSGV